MPSSTALVSPSAETSRANSSSVSASSSILSEIVSQPRRLPISGTPGPPQRLSSRRQTRRATSSSIARFTRSATAGSSSFGSVARIVSGRPVVTAWRRASMPSSSFFIATANCSMPSTSSLSVTSFISTPASASAFSSRSTSAGSGSAVAPGTSPCSAKATSVGSGIVLTVSGATRPSTYFVSE